MSIIAPLDKEHLSASGLLSPVRPDGTRRIHKRRLNRSSDEENSDVPLVPITDSNNEDAFVTIPEDLMSEATLRYLGYNDEIAEVIWGRWFNWPSGPIIRETDLDRSDCLIMTFIHFATGHAEGRGRENDVTCDDDDEAWHNCMNACGIALELQNAIMDPVFNEIRHTESCAFWIVDTMEMRYRNLEEAQETSRGRERALERARSQPSSCDESATQRLNPGIEQDTALSSKLLTAQNAPGFTILYKGLDQARINGLFDHDGNVKDIARLTSQAPSDFLKELGFYFAVDKDIALDYAAYAKRRDGAASVVLIQMAIPTSAIESFSETELHHLYWPSAEWKSLVFHSRRLRRVPVELRRFRQGTLIIGTMATKPGLSYLKLESAEDMTDDMVKKNKDGHPAIQYVLPLDEGEDFLSQHGRLAVLLLTSAEYRQLYKGPD